MVLFKKQTNHYHLELHSIECNIDLMGVVLTHRQKLAIVRMLELAQQDLKYPLQFDLSGSYINVKNNQITLL